jgi:hypothetical protein
MRNLLKTIAIFFSSVLLFTSIITEQYCFILNSHKLSSNRESLSSHLPDRSTELFLSNYQGHKLVASVKDLPVFNLRYQAPDIYCNSLIPQLKSLRINSEYLQFAWTISRNLTNIDIVFPFHYFW